MSSVGAGRFSRRGMFLSAQSALGLGKKAAARKLLRHILEKDPSHGMAADPLGEIG